MAKKGKATVNNTSPKKKIEAEEKQEIIEEQENFLDEKPKNKDGLFKKIFDVVFWIVILFLLVVWIVDFGRMKNEKDPKFCVSTREYKDDAKTGTITECFGLGYKVYKHKTNDKTIRQFRFILSKYVEEK